MAFWRRSSVGPRRPLRVEPGRQTHLLPMCVPALTLSIAGAKAQRHRPRASAGPDPTPTPSPPSPLVPGMLTSSSCAMHATNSMKSMSPEPLTSIRAMSSTSSRGVGNVPSECSSWPSSPLSMVPLPARGPQGCGRAQGMHGTGQCRDAALPAPSGPRWGELGGGDPRAALPGIGQARLAGPARPAAAAPPVHACPRPHPPHHPCQTLRMLCASPPDARAACPAARRTPAAPGRHLPERTS